MIHPNKLTTITKKAYIGAEFEFAKIDYKHSSNL